MKLCPPDICSGCGACVAICPVGCIAMKEDSYGVKHPEIGPECIECGNCVKTCPVLVEPVFREPETCLAVWNDDAAERRLSASGGVAAALAHLYAGRVYSTTWNSSLQAVVRSGTAEEFKGSRYVQSSFSKECYREIHSRLRNGEQLLFIGTPCQVAALIKFVGKDADGLLTADLLCHGVCPESYFSEELDRIGKRERTTNIRFRGNDAYDYHLSLWDGEKCIYDEPAASQPYFRAFLEALSLRENCYTCPYARPQRVADITLGDFIGLEGKKSSVCLNTPKGRKAVEDLLKAFPSLQAEEHPYSERLQYRPSILEPTKKSPLREKFLEAYAREGFSKAARITLRKELAAARRKDCYRKAHHIGHLIKKAIFK